MDRSSHNDTPDTSLKIWSCVICRRRKVRCDRKDPCSNCIKSNIDCHFPVTGRIPRRSRDPNVDKTPAQKQSELLSRLRRLESVVTELAAQVEDENGAAIGSAAMGQITVDASTSYHGTEYEDFGRLVVDKDGGLHVGNRFWSVFCGEVDNILQAVHDVADYSESSSSVMTEPAIDGSPSALSHLGFVFGSAEFAKALDGLNPMPSQMLFIWQAYVENVDPFIKVLHVPTVEKIVRELKGNFSSCGTNVEPLLFAISLAAITSMDEETVSFNFNTPRAQLLQRYQFGTEQALARANFLSTKDITVLQALVIYLSLLPNIGAQDKVWPLTGLVLRLAKSAGLHLEDDHNQYNQLEREIRRRLWWQICFIDSSSRRADAQDLSITPASFSTGLPTNTNDVDLDGSTTQLPSPDQGSTAVTLCLIRCELWYLTQAIRADQSNSQGTRLSLFNALKEKVEKTYFQHLQSNKPWDSFITAMAKLFFAKVELVIRRRSGNGAPTDELLRPSIEVITSVHALQSEPSWTKWRWQLQGQMPWHAMGVFLRQVSRIPWTRELEEAWRANTALRDSATKDMKTGSLWKSLMELNTVAEKHREKELKRQGANAQNTRQHGDRVNSDVQQMLDNAANMSSDIPVNHPLIDTSTFNSSLHISPPDTGALSIERLSTGLGAASDDLPSWSQAGGEIDLDQFYSFGNSSSDKKTDEVDWEVLMDLDETWNWNFL
ncbi:hypothetical protein FHETE_1997 [Fusarium heterosporum]|uniref:Zn(2)-C6 fungal-type domain-containing protein n=1 Tax=Fusarium heterosporum TaxID=42747 RepID=A0A8H5X0J6_FUSHE|nr:hypothetical protein FHETE_1997 [Fusarium heterosporum]